jgi:formiminotetrahydrofolate cyclodeaminase
MTLWNTTLAEFREQVASSAPTPGGGAVASVGGALGLGLVVMAIEISRKGGDERTRELDVLLTQAREILGRLTEHADHDVRVFQAYMAAAALPRALDEEKRARKNAMSDAALAAASAPLAAAADMVTALGIARAAAPLIKRSVASDVLGGADLLAGSVTAALRNVDVNLAGLASDDLRARVRSDREELARRAAQAYQAVTAAFG